MDLIVDEKAPVAADTIRLTLSPADGGPLPHWEPGAHIELSFAGFVRRYSLTSSPHDTARYQVCVLRAERTRGGSAYLHDRLQVGDRLPARGPRNGFALNREARHSVFFAGGIGITPFPSMMEELARHGRSFDLHYAVRHPDRLLLVPDHGGRTRRYIGSTASERLQVDSVLDQLDRNVDLYVCGPRALIGAVRAGAAARGWPPGRVHFESFGAVVEPFDRPVRVHLELSGITVEVLPGTTILAALLAQGVWAPSACERGECGSCTTEVLRGEPDHRDFCLTPEQRRSSMCPCVSWARAPDLVLNL